MIRFNCPTCDRAYLLADAYAGLPLVCKGCGNRLTLPEPTAEPEPAPPAKASGGGKPGEPPGTGGRAGAARPPLADEPPEVPPAVPGPGPVLASGGREPPGGSSPEGSRPPLARSPDTSEREPSAPPPAPPAPRPATGRRLVALLVDVVVVVLLLAAGALAGEEVVGRSSREVVEEAGSAPVFPPTDLLVWGGCVLVFVLVYAWLGTRGRTVGGWLRRRAS